MFRPQNVTVYLLALLCCGTATSEIELDATHAFVVELPGDTEAGEASLREHAVTWSPDNQCYYLVADVVPLDNPHHPNTYETDIHLWKSADLATWTYLGLAIPKGGAGRFDAHGVASPAGIVWYRGKLLAAYSARKTDTFTQRGIGLAWSGANPADLPWSKAEVAISDLLGEDDDPALLQIPGDNRLHLYHRTTGGESGYRIVHTASATPLAPDSWPDAVDVTRRPPGVRAQELTGAAWYDGLVHLFIIEQGDGVKGAPVAHLVSDSPDGPFRPADPENRYMDTAPARLAYSGHFTPVTRDGRLEAGFWTAFQSGPRYGLVGHPLSWREPR